MKTDIKLAGVGGQGILTIATVIGQAATAAGLQLKQAEVHGMSQRGGAVESDLRLSDEAIFSDQIGLGTADLIVSMEPMEALRYLPYLGPKGTVVTSSAPFVNIPDYPAAEVLQADLQALPSVALLDIEAVARSQGAPKSANMVLLGMTARHLAILPAEALREAIRTVFARKGEKVVEDNLKAFDAGYEGI